MASAKALTRARNISDLRELAQRRLPRFSFEYVDGGAEDEVTMAANRAAFADVQILPRQLASIAGVDMSVDVLGKLSALPIAVAPTGYNGMLARGGDLALARTAQAAGFPFTQSTMSSSTIEEVAAVMAGGRHWFQLYMLKDIAITKRLIERALAAGCEALVLTSDAIVLGNREGDKHNYAGPGKLTWRAKMDVASRLSWVLDVVVPRGPPGFGNLAEFLPRGQGGAIDGARFISAQMDAALSWESVSWLRSNWPRKLVVKGIMRADDALAAAERGVDAIVVSNHGGRQLDGAATSLGALPAIRKALDGRCDVILDSGIRRGADIFKAMALGANAVLCGRAMLYGLAAGGAAGAARSVEILRAELERTMMLAGQGSLKHLDRSALFERSPFLRC